jgi:hypothetical protein
MVTYIHGVALSFFFSPNPLLHCCPLSLPFVLPFTYLAPSSCDRNCPPSYQVACRLTPFAPPLTQSTHPFQILKTPIAQRLTTTTLGPLRFHYAEHVLFSRWRVYVALAVTGGSLMFRPQPATLRPASGNKTSR